MEELLLLQVVEVRAGFLVMGLVGEGRRRQVQKERRKLHEPGKSCSYSSFGTSREILGQSLPFLSLRESPLWFGLLSDSLVFRALGSGAKGRIWGEDLWGHL